jgi:hypothetical protein
MNGLLDAQKQQKKSKVGIKQIPDEEAQFAVKNLLPFPLQERPALGVPCYFR